ncbi:MAG: glycerophosphoryl diester phosphodiesterase [Thermoproteota archaeon]|jgi:glycerophosphoryl diester phosphodiesterase
MNLITKILILATISACSTQNKLYIAHRAASGYLPEHTLESVTLAHTFNIDYIEPDVVLTKDNHLVVLHDHFLDTTTNVAKVYPRKKRKDGRYYAIDFTLKQIQRLMAHERIDLRTKKAVFPNRYPYKVSTSFRVPTLNEYIEYVTYLNSIRGKEVGLYIETKAPEFHLKNGKNIVKALTKTLNKYGLNHMNSKVIVQSFEPQSLKEMSKVLKVPLVQLIADNFWGESSADYDQMMTDQGLKDIAKYAHGVGPWITHLLKPANTNFVQLAHKHGLKVHAYTARQDALPDQFKSLAELYYHLFTQLNIDGVFSDFSDKQVY